MPFHGNELIEPKQGHRTMPMFRASIVNLPGYGEVSTTHKWGWTRDKYVLSLDERTVTIKQRKSVLTYNGNNLRGTQIATSVINVSGVKSMDEGQSIVDDICWLLCFAAQSSVHAYKYSYGNERKYNQRLGVYNAWRPPFHSGWGSISDFVQQAWPQFRRKNRTRPLAGFIHILEISDLPDSVMESNIAATMQCLESIKTYFALDEGRRYQIHEERDGKFKDQSGCEVTFKRLLELTLQDVGMTPPSLTTIIRLRNALIHRGFIRETDRITRYIFGANPAGGMYQAMFEVKEDVQDILREYMLRLLGYKGPWCTYKLEGNGRRTIS